jgi:F-type H+-transporting ATPase subunit b
LKRRCLSLAFAVTLAVTASLCGEKGHLDTEHGSGKKPSHQAPDFTFWRWANFSILLAVVVWLMAKKAGPYFHTRSRQIQEAIAEASQLLEEAERRLKEAESRLGNLEKAIEELRRQAREELVAQSQRAKLETERALAKIQAQAEMEIAAAVRASLRELKAYTAALAVDLAERKLASELSPDRDRALVRDFVSGLKCLHPAAPRGGESN